MNKEYIEKAAKKAIHEHYNCNGRYGCSERDYCKYMNGKNSAYDCCECGADEFYEGFIKGAEWRINSVWHEASEQPELGEKILIQSKLGGVITLYVDLDIKATFKRFNVVRWAYVSDLLPKSAENIQQPTDFLRENGGNPRENTGEDGQTKE